MRLVVDSNVLFTFFWKKSVSRTLFRHPRLELYTPEFSLEEIREHADEIREKTDISEQEFSQTIQELVSVVTFIPSETYRSFMRDAVQRTRDPDDCDVIALALQLHCPLWSNDKNITNVDSPAVVTTPQVIVLLESVEG